MQDKSKNELIVYYVVAAVSIFVLISYGSTKDIPPIVGFLITGMAVYILYPNETIALIMALIVSTILRRTRREGFTEGIDETIQEPFKEGLKRKKKKGKKRKTTMVEDEEEEDPDYEDETEEFTNPVPTSLPSSKSKTAPKQGFALNPANYNMPSGAPSSQDMDKLSGMIDQTMKLIEMLPDGFLQNATNNNTA